MKAEYKPFVDELIELAIKEDIGDGDHTSLCCIPAEDRYSHHSLRSLVQQLYRRHDRYDRCAGYAR